MTSITEHITNIAAPLAASLGIALWGVEFAPGGRSVLRVFVEGAGDTSGADCPVEVTDCGDDEADAFSHGVTIEQCAELSRMLGLALDVEDILPGAYVLEVSSPGLDRAFFSASQLAGALGRTVEVTYADPPDEYPGRRRFRGVLEEADPEAGFALRLEDAALPGETPPLLRFIFEKVKKVKQVFVVPEKERPGKSGKKGKARRTESTTA